MSGTNAQYYAITLNFTCYYPTSDILAKRHICYHAVTVRSSISCTRRKQASCKSRYHQHFLIDFSGQALNQVM